MKIIAAVLLLLAAPLAAQSIAPSQIKPGTNGQSLQTVAGKAAWANSSTSVPSVFGRTGPIVPLTGDYNCSQVTGSICSLPTLFNQLIKIDGAALTQRGIVNFINGSAGTVSCVDNPVTLATDCTITGGSTTGVTWTISDVSGSRSVGTAKQNTSAWPMFVGGSLATTGSGTGSITVAQGTSMFAMTLIDWKNQSTATVSSGSAGFSAVIAPNNYYVMQVSGAVTTAIQSWTEMTGSGTGGGGGGSGFTAAGDLSGSSSSQTVVGLDSVPFCTGFTPTNGQFLELTTGSSPNPCYTAATPSGSGNTTSTSLTTNRIPKANGANSIIDSSVSDNGTTVSTTEPLTAPAVNTVINAGSSLSAAVTACGSAQTTIQITQTIAVGTGITVPANCTLLFQSAGNLTGTSIAINGAVQAPPVQIFGAGLAVTGLRGPVLAEWFGVAQPYASIAAAAAGADDSTKAQAAANAITLGGWVQFRCGYYHVNTLTFTNSNNGAKGLCPGYSYPSASQSTILVSSSATAPQVTFGNGSGGAQIVWNVLEDIALQRSVHPTGSTSAGLSIDNAGGLYASNVKVEDSLPLVYAHMAPSYGYGLYRVSADWGESVVAGSAYAVDTPKGFYIDSADGNEENSLNIVDAEVNCVPLRGTGAVTTGYLITGTALSDVNVENGATAGCSHSSRVTYSGGTAGVASNVRFDNFVADGSVIDSALVENVRSGSHGSGGSVTYNGGVLSGGTSCNVDVENSLGVNFTGKIHIDSGIRSCVNGSSDVSFEAQFNNIGFPDTKGLVFSGSVNNRVISTFTNLGSGASANIDVEFDSSSTGNVVDGSTFSQAATNAVKCDGTSGANVVGVNSYDPLVTTPVNGCGNASVFLNGAGGYTSSGSGIALKTNTGLNTSQAIFDATTSTVNAVGLTITPSNPSAGVEKWEVTGAYTGTVADSALTAGQQVVAGASGLLSNGGTAILSCADTSASGTAQSCTTSPSFTPAANSCVMYTTTTANSGTGLTLNVNSLGAKSVAKWLGTTTLAVGDVAANSPQLACYNGTVWNLSTIGNAPSGGGGSITFPQTVAGTVNSGGLVYANSGTQISVSPAGTGGQVVLWGGAGTAPGAQAIGTSGATIPLLNGANNSSGNDTFSAAGAASTPGVLFNGAPFTGGSGTTTFPYIYVNNGASGPTAFSTSGTEFGINAPSGWGGNFLDFHVNGAASIFSVGNNGITNGRSFVANGSLAQLTATGYAEGAALASIGTKFTTSGCSVSSTTGGGSVGTFTLGANSCTVVITIGAVTTGAPNGWSCQAHDRTAPTVLIGGESSSTTTTASITIPAGAGTTDVISFACIAF